MTGHISRREGSTMRVRLTLDQGLLYSVRKAIPALLAAGAIEPKIRESRNDDGPFELQFRLNDGSSPSAVLGCAGLGEVSAYARQT